MKQSVYIETTVLNYLTSRPSRDILVAAHQQVTVEWWENGLPLLEAFISPLVIEEASWGDETAARSRLEKIAGFSILEINEEVRRLAELYFERIPIAEKARGDAYHSSRRRLPRHGLLGVLESWAHPQSSGQGCCPADQCDPGNQHPAHLYTQRTHGGMR